MIIKKTWLLVLLGGLFLSSLVGASILLKESRETRSKAATCGGLVGTHCNKDDCYDYTCDETTGQWIQGKYCGPKCTEHSTYCMECKGSSVPTGSQSECPFDVTPYVKQVAGANSGFNLCNAYNSSIGCLRLELPAQYAHCRYLAEAYTDPRQFCDNQQTHLRIRREISNGGTICLSEVNFSGDCSVQIDIRFDQSGAPAGNLKAYLQQCGGPPPPTNTPTPRPTNTPTPKPTNTPTPTPTPVYSCSCRTIDVYNQSWQLVTDYAVLAPGTSVFIAVSGVSDHPLGITKARIRVNGGTWRETTNRRGEMFYITYQIPSYGDYRIEGQVYNPVLGWR